MNDIPNNPALTGRGSEVRVASHVELARTGAEWRRMRQKSYFCNIVPSPGSSREAESCDDHLRPLKTHAHS